MPWSNRKECESEIYHVVIRGVGRQILFEDDEDRLSFMAIMEKLTQEHTVVPIAWCLMSNHVHLVLHASITTVSAFMHRLETSYALRFNVRHDRVGTLFQGRFASFPIEDDAQLIETILYVHNNPVKVGGPLDYRWSSYRMYKGNSRTAELQRVVDIFGSEEEFERLHARSTGCKKPAVERGRARLTQAEALELARSVLGNHSIHEVKAMQKAERDEYLREMKEAGLSIRQIERLTSIGRGVVANA